MTTKSKRGPTSAPSVYIAGPMRGKDHYNFPAFFDAEADLTDRGFIVHNPARHDIERGFDPEETIEANGFDVEAAMRADIGLVLAVDHVFVLPGWQGSTGARLEAAVAQAAGIPVVDYETGASVQVTVETRVA